MMLRACVLSVVVLAAVAVPVPEPSKPLAAVAMDSKEMNGEVNGTAETKPSNEKHASESGLPDIAIAIPTMRRFSRDGSPAYEKYLTPLIHGICQDMTPEQKQHVTFVMLNVDKSPDKHEELLGLHASLGTPPLDNVKMTVINKQQNEHVNMSSLLNADGLYQDAQGRTITAETLNWRAGETMDAPRLWVTAQAQTKASFVLFLEDDVKPTSHVVSKLYELVAGLKSGGKLDNFLMLDLYTPDVEYARKPTGNLEWYDYECCTQAMLLNGHRLSSLVDYEFDHPDSPVDDNIRDFVRQNINERMVYSAVPNLFEHVGRLSTNYEKSSDVVEHVSYRFEP